MPWTLDTMKVDECFNRVHLSLGWLGWLGWLGFAARFSHLGGMMVFFWDGYGITMAAMPGDVLMIVNYKYL